MHDVYYGTQLAAPYASRFPIVSPANRIGDGLSALRIPKKSSAIVETTRRTAFALYAPDENSRLDRPSHSRIFRP